MHPGDTDARHHLPKTPMGFSSFGEGSFAPVLFGIVSVEAQRNATQRDGGPTFKRIHHVRVGCTVEEPGQGRTI
jgi:hypothetical protein